MRDAAIIMTKKIFQGYLRSKGLKSTHQREILVDLFLQADKHYSIEELYHEAQKEDNRIGYSTVYRTLKLLVEAGLAEERQFSGGVTRFELVHRGKHHDHLICIKCGRIIEFTNDRIEKLQEVVAKKHNFKITDHKCEIYGYCSRCKK